METPLRAFVLLLVCSEPRMKLGDHCSAFADSGRDALGRACAHVADREYARNRCFECERLAARAVLPARIRFCGHQIESRANETFVVQPDAAVSEPGCVGIGA